MEIDSKKKKQKYQYDGLDISLFGIALLLLKQQKLDQKRFGEMRTSPEEKKLMKKVNSRATFVRRHKLHFYRCYITDTIEKQSFSHKNKTREHNIQTVDEIKSPLFTKLREQDLPKTCR